MQLVNNSLKISVVSRNAQHQNTPNSDGVTVVKSYVQNGTFAPINEIFNQFSNNAQPNTFYIPKSTSPSELETFNVSTQTTSVMFPFGYSFFNGAQSPLSKLIHTSTFNFNNFQYNTIYHGSNANAIEVANGPLQAGLLPLFPNSALVNNIANIGTALFGTVSLDGYYNNSSKQPAIVLEFETINSQVQSQTGYSFASQGNSGISAFISLAGSGNDVNNGFVAAHSLSFNRSKYRQINVQINEKTINSWVGFQNKTQNNYIAKGYGYELWYGDTKLGSVPADVVDKAKEQGYDPTRKEFRINLKFNADISKLPVEMMQTYSSFMNPNKLVIKKVYKNPGQVAFFANSRFPFEWDSQPDNDGQNLGGISLNPNSLKEKGIIEFVDYTQWLGSGTSRLGYNKLMALNNVTAQTQSSAWAPSGSIYQGNNYSYSNTALLNNQINSFNDAIYNDWKASDFTAGFWDIKLNDVKQGIFDITNTINTLPPMNKVAAYSTNPDSISPDALSVKKALTLSNLGSNATNYYSAYLLADDATRKAFMQAYGAINDWKNNSTPNFVTEGDTIVDENNVAQNFKNYVQNIKDQEKQLLNYKGIGFKPDESLTARQFIDEAFVLIDSAPLYTTQYKTAFKDIIMQQTSRQAVIKYVNAIVNLANKYNTAKSTYQTYLPVSTNSQYSNIQNTKDPSYNMFVYSLTQMKTLLENFDKYQEQNVDTSIIGAKTLIDLDNKINPEYIVQRYQSIISDITTAISKINGLVNVPGNDKQSYTNKLWDLVKNNGPYGETYRLLANYALREAKIAIIVNTAKMQDLLLQKNKDVASFAQKFNLNFSSFKYTNNISRSSIHEVDVSISNGTSPVTIITYEDIHPDLPFVMNGNKKIYIIPNTTAESASVNYHWQEAAFEYIILNKKFSEQSETFTKINQEETAQLSSYLFENFVSALSYNSGVLLTEQEVNDFYNNRIALLNTFITQLEKLNSAYNSTADTRINKAQYNFYLKKFIDLIFTQSMRNNTTEITNGINEIKAEITELQSSMGQLKEVLDKYILPSKDADSSNSFAANPKDNIFQNGQFYGLGNLDKFARLYKGKYTFKMPENNGKLVALITTALQVLEILPSNINEIANGEGEEAQLVAARTGFNLPSVLRMTTFDTQTPYNWFVYNKDQISKLKDAIAATANSLDGRYNALTNYFEYAANKYFSSINAKNQPLVPDISNAIKLYGDKFKIPAKEAYSFENDSMYYNNISNIIVLFAKNTINTLSNLSQSEKTHLINKYPMVLTP
ncbi:hypothetical protein [Mycoplasma sp. Z473B]|uniref:hypothetical protein n=1 Tax=Mycoplasma sp. Z473B TaxID=3401667 RepID=UPI003AAEE567